MLWYEGQQAPFTPTPQDASYLMRLLSRKGGLFVLKGACMGSCPAKTTDGDFVCKPLRAKYLCLSRGCLAGGASHLCRRMSPRRVYGWRDVGSFP